MPATPAPAHVPLTLVAILMLACSGTAARPDGGVRSADAGSAPAASALTFAPPAPFSAPIDDYVTFHQNERGGALDFQRSLSTLFTFEDRLYLGYGDATLNLGRTTAIEIRAYTDPALPPRAEATTAEEEIELYRRCGAILCIPGIDATEDGLVGNVYLRDAAPEGGGAATTDGGGSAPAWRKIRGIPGALHVHDMTSWRGALYAVGSGAPTLAEYEAQHIRAYLWRSRNGGTTWEIALERVNTAGGDMRFTHLLPLSDALYVFGYRSSGGTVAEFLPYRFDGSALEAMPLPSLQRLFVLGSWVVAPGRGLLRGIDASVRPLRHRAYVVENGAATLLAGELSDATVADAAPQDDGTTLLLTYAGNLRDREAPDAPYEARVLLSTDLSSFRALTRADFPADAPPRSLAYWRGAIYLGDAAGTLWRAPGTPTTTR